MKKIIILAALVWLVGSISTSMAIHETIPAETFVPLPGPYAERVYRYIVKSDLYSLDISQGIMSGKDR